MLGVHVCCFFFVLLLLYMSMIVVCQDCYNYLSALKHNCHATKGSE